MPSDSLKAKSIGGVTQTLAFREAASDHSLSLELMMYAASVLAQTVDILRLLCRGKLSLLKRRIVERLNCFVPLKKKQKKNYCVASAGVNNTQRKEKELICLLL